MNKLALIILSLLLTFGCTDSGTSEQQRILELEEQLAVKKDQINELQNQLTKQTNSEPEHWYAFDTTTEYNIVKLSEGESEKIDQIELIDSVDAVFTFEHTTVISQLKDARLSNFFANLRQYRDIFHGSQEYGPMSDDIEFGARVFVVCEEPGLPIETENCTDNIYILLQPTELGYENNLFKISRLYGTAIKSLVNLDDGVLLTLEHSRNPRKELKVFIKPQLVKFVE